MVTHKFNVKSKAKAEGIKLEMVELKFGLQLVFLLIYFKFMAMMCKSLQSRDLTIREYEDSCDKLLIRLDVLQESGVQDKLVDAAEKVNKFLKKSIPTIPRVSRARPPLPENIRLQMEKALIMEFRSKFSIMVHSFQQVIEEFKTAEKASCLKYKHILKLENLKEGDEYYAEQQEGLAWLKFKGISYERFIKDLEITTVKLESGFSTMKYIENRLRQSMGDDQLEINMLGYFNKDWLMEIEIEDVVEEVMTAGVTVFGE